MTTERLTWTLEAGVRAGAGTGDGKAPAMPVWDGNGLPWCVSTCPHCELPSLAVLSAKPARSRCRIANEDTIPSDKLTGGASLCAPSIAAMARMLDAPRLSTPIKRGPDGRRIS